MKVQDFTIISKGLGSLAKVDATQIKFGENIWLREWS